MNDKLKNEDFLNIGTSNMRIIDIQVVRLTNRLIETFNKSIPESVKLSKNDSELKIVISQIFRTMFVHFFDNDSLRTLAHFIDVKMPNQKELNLKPFVDDDISFLFFRNNIEVYILSAASAYSPRMISDIVEIIKEKKNANKVENLDVVACLPDADNLIKFALELITEIKTNSEGV